jgi:trigger factor
LTTANVTKLEENRVRLDVEVPPEAVREGVEAKVRELRGKVRIPGFRPGKAPRRMVENHLGRDYVYMEALQDSLPTWYSQAVVEADLRPIDTPKIDFDGPLDEQNGFKFSAEVEVRPEATLGEYKGLEVPKREVEVDEAQVEAQIEEFRGQFATLAAVEDRPVKEGDYAVIDFKGERLTGGPLEGGEAEDYMLEVGGGELLPDFEKELVGMGAGERKRFAVAFPADYAEPSLQGQSVLFNVHLKEIKERELPELDDEFAQEASEFETLAEFREAVRGQIEGALQQQVEGEFRNRVLDEVAKRAEVAVPDAMVHEKAHEMVESFERSIRSQGMEPEQYYQLAGSSHHDVEERVKPDAEDTVKKELVLDAVAAAEGIQADEAEMAHQISHLAEDSERSPEDITETMRRNGTYALLREEISRSKALDFLVENSKAVPMPEEEPQEEEGEMPEGPVDAAEGVVEPEAGTDATEGGAQTVEAGASTESSEGKE